MSFLREVIMKQRLTIISFILLAVLPAHSLFSGGKNGIPKDCVATNTVTGKVIMSGSVPHHFLTLRTADKSYVIEAKDKEYKTLSGFQNQTIEAKGCVTPQKRPEALALDGTLYLESYSVLYQ